MQFDTARRSKRRMAVALAGWLALAWLATHESHRAVVLGRYSAEFTVVLALALLAALALTHRALRSPVRARSGSGGNSSLAGALAASAVSLLLALGAAEIAVRSLDLFGVSLYQEISRYVMDLEADPELVYRQRAGFSARYQGQEFRFNSLGLREREPAAKAPGTKRILVLGDSVTLAWGAAMEDGFVRRLEPLLAAQLGIAVETINSGVSGYNTTQEWAFLRRYGESLAPDRIVLMYVPNDIEPAQKNLLELREHWEHPQGSSEFLLRWSWLYRIASRFVPYLFSAEKASRSDPGWRESMASLQRIADYARERRIPFAVCLYRMTPSRLTDELRADLETAGKAGHFAVCDTLPWFAGADLRAVTNSLIDTHPNAAGHRILAEHLAAFLAGVWRDMPPGTAGAN